MPNRITYRADIDGLRALAVVLVVLFHYFPGTFSGGFVGVDVFFVISGYLISRIIYNELTDGSIDLLGFYVNRVLRIFPALLLVAITLVITGWFFFLPAEYKELGKHVSAGLLFVENFLLWNETGYFDVEALQKPLMHLWSLAVEEQFYIVFPPLIYWAFRKKISLNFLIIFALLSSLLINLVFTYLIDPKLAFLSPVSRYWELMIGGLLALRIENARVALDKYFGKSFPTESISALGLSLILLSAYVFEDNSPYPGVRAIMPTLGAAMIILANETNRVSTFVLSNKFTVFIGSISYSLYLWHWTILSAAVILIGGRPSVLISCSLIMLSVALAVASTYLIERPLRYKRRGRNKISIVLIILSIFLAFIGYNTYDRDGLSFRMQSLYRLNNKIGLRSVSFDDTIIYSANCKDRYPDFEGGCFLQHKAAPTVAVLGNSHSGNMFEGLAKITNDQKDINFINLRRNGALVLLGVGTYEPKSYLIDQREIQKTALINKQAFDILANTKSIETVVLLLSGNSYFEHGKKITTLVDHPDLEDGRVIWKTALEDSLFFLRNHGKKVIVFLDWPKLTIPSKSCFSTPGPAANETEKLHTLCKMTREESVAKDKEFYEMAISITNKFNDVKVFTSSDYLCDTKSCSASINSELIYSDQEHLTMTGSKFLGEKLLRFLGEK